MPPERNERAREVLRDVAVWQHEMERSARELQNAHPSLCAAAEGSGKVARTLADAREVIRELLDAPATPPTRDGEGEGFVPCPTCHQYSHSIGADKLADAFNHFQSMYGHPARGHPMGHNFDEATRDAAQVLMAAARGAPIAARADGGEVLEAIAADIDHAVAGGMSWISHGEAVEFSRRIRALAAQPANSSDREVAPPANEGLVERLEGLTARAEPQPFDRRDTWEKNLADTELFEELKAALPQILTALRAATGGER